MTVTLTICPECHAKDKRIAQLERDLQQASEGIDLMTRKWLEAKEGKKSRPLHTLIDKGEM